jgi:hypothetical protein
MQLFWERRMAQLTDECDGCNIGGITVHPSCDGEKTRIDMRRLGIGLLCALTITSVGCQTGSQRQNIPTTGADGQNVGRDSNKQGGPVPGSTTGTESNLQQQPAEQQQQPVPDTSGQAPPK